MILRFPSGDVLQLAITSETIPRDVTSAPVAAGLDAEGSVWLKPSVSIRRTDLAALKRLGAEQKKSTSVALEPLSCWHQMLPLTCVDAGLSEQQEILFWLNDKQPLSEIVTEMLRLGNDRQSFTRLADPRSDAGES